jgi:hypothetical protein
MATPKNRFRHASPTPVPEYPDNPFRRVILASAIFLLLVFSLPFFAEIAYGAVR